MTDASDILLQAVNLHKHYRMGGEDLHVLRGVDLAVHEREMLAILGASGSGKSTLLHLLGGLDRPSAQGRRAKTVQPQAPGQVLFHGQDIFRLKGAKLDRYRNRHVGFVFQFYHLLPELTALENVLIGAMLGASLFAWPRVRKQVRLRAASLLETVGLKDRMRHRPGKLSGGERQRVAIARALINEPDVLLADEPTGNLDARTGTRILDVFAQLHEQGQTLVLVTHDAHVAAAADRQLTLTQGRLEPPKAAPDASPPVNESASEEAGILGIGSRE